jgi:hypothetical protein
VNGRTAVLRYSLLLLLLLPMGSVSAYDIVRVGELLAQELNECAAYYLVSASLVRAQQPELAEKNKQIAMEALAYSLALTDKEETRARGRAAVISMHQDLKSGAASLATLTARYADQCAKTVDNPEERADYWLKKQD